MSDGISLNAECQDCRMFIPINKPKSSGGFCGLHVCLDGKEGEDYQGRLRFIKLDGCCEMFKGV